MMNVVVVDDEPNIVELVSHMIDPGLATVVGTALNGIDAYDRVADRRPDILITDVRMPGYSGLQLIEKVKTSYPDTDIIVISGYREFDYLQSILRFGVQEFLLKPVESEELNAAILRIDQKRSRADSHARYVEDMAVNLTQSYKRLREEYTLKVLYNGAACLKRDRLPENLFSFQQGNFCVALLKADCVDEPGEQAGNDLPYVRMLLERYRDTILTSFRDECHEVAHAIHGDKVYFIFNYASNMAPAAFWNRPGFNALYISDMLVTENYKYNFLHFTLGIGVAVDSIDKIGESLRAAICAVGNRLNPHSGGVIEGRSVPDSDTGGTAVLDAGLRSRLAAAITSLDAGKLAEVYSESVEAVAVNGEYYRIFDLTGAVLRMVRNAVVMQNLLNEDECVSVESVENRLDNCFTMEMVQECLSAHFEKMTKKIREASANRASQPIREAQEYMRKNYASPITLKSVADVIHYSPNYFSNAFREQTGMTFLDYLTELRMEASKHMLKNSSRGIGEIAHDVGYADEKYFSKLFVKIVGIKPNEFRKFYS